MASTTAYRWIFLTILIILAVVAGWSFLNDRDTWPRGEALGVALRPVIEGKNPEQALVARAILENYLETRTNASRWSGVYWGFTFLAAAFGAIAGLVLKLETLVKNEGIKKDLAATLSIAAALLVTVSTSGDFQRKWQANRISAAEIERIGYDFLEKNGADPRAFLGAVGQSLLRRHMAILGSSEPNKSAQELGKAASAGR